MISASRYEIQLSTDSKKDWSPADEFYRTAISVYPEGERLMGAPASTQSIELATSPLLSG